VRIQIIDSAESLLEQFKKLFVWSEEVDMAYAWASAQEGRSLHWKAMDLGKLRRAVIGTQFAQTEPWALRRLNDLPDRLRVAISSEGTFHPKVAIGRRKDEIRAIVGSANLTSAAFSRNTELNILLSGTASDPELRRLISFVHASWNMASVVTEEWLARYELAWRNRPKVSGLVPNAVLEVTGPSSLQMSWDSYFDLVQKQEGRKLTSGYSISVLGEHPSYEVELDRAQAAFNAHMKYEAMPPEHRKLVVGTGPLSSGLLGTMRAAGFAKALVNREPEKIGRYLDPIPLVGEVPIELVAATVEGLTSLHGVSIGVASRLLAAKRPDLFVSVNNGSKPALSRLLGRNVDTSEKYVDLLKLVWSTDWHASATPEDIRQRRVWKRRAAMLDSALYEEL
jgi:HKD family nuclease